MNYVKPPAWPSVLGCIFLIVFILWYFTNYITGESNETPTYAVDIYCPNFTARGYGFGTHPGLGRIEDEKGWEFDFDSRNCVLVWGDL